MIIKRTGKITENFYAIGSPVVPVYLLDGPKPVLFEAGFTAVANLYIKGIKEILLKRKPYCLFLTHSHFDHVGSAGFFREVWPELRIAGSEKSREVLRRPGAVSLITDLNREGIQTMRSECKGNINEEPFKAFDIDIVIEPDQEIRLAPDITVKALHTPGHTWDFLSYWIPEKKILIGSEALGCYERGDYIQSEFLVDYDLYKDSLKRLAQLDVRVLCPGHHAVLTGRDVKEFMQRSIKAAEDYASFVEKLLVEEDGDIDRTVARVKAVEWDHRPWPKQPEQAYLLNTRLRVETILKRAGKG